jgi:hypothetical protein
MTPIDPSHAANAAHSVLQTAAVQRQQAARLRRLKQQQEASNVEARHEPQAVAELEAGDPTTDVPHRPAPAPNRRGRDDDEDHIDLRA